MADNTLSRMLMVLNYLFDLICKVEWLKQQPYDVEIGVRYSNLIREIIIQKGLLAELMRQTFGSGFTQEQVDSFVDNFVAATKRSMS